MGASGESRVRKHVIVHGHVQGVYFRATAREIASQHPVSGYVRNQPNGTVELEAQGANDAVDAYLAAVYARYKAHISHMDETVIDPREPESGFVIRY